MKNIKFITIFIIFIIISCNQKQKNNPIDKVKIDKETIKSNIIGIKKSQVKMFSQKDSIELYAIDGYYFGKMSDTITKRNNTKIGGIDFGIPYYYEDNYIFIARRSNNFQLTIDDINKLIRIISYKYGTPYKKTIEKKTKVAIESMYYSLYLSDDYQWKDKYKKITMSYMYDKDNNLIVDQIKLNVSNNKIEEFTNKNKKKNNINMIKDESKKL